MFMPAYKKKACQVFKKPLQALMQSQIRAKAHRRRCHFSVYGGLLPLCRLRQDCVAARAAAKIAIKAAIFAAKLRKVIDLKEIARPFPRL
jgi:hypothetical protein